MQNSDISRKIKFCEIRNLLGFDLQKYLFTEISWKALERLLKKKIKKIK